MVIDENADKTLKAMGNYEYKLKKKDKNYEQEFGLQM